MCSTPHRPRIVRRSLDHPDAALLVAEVQAEYTEIYGTPDDAPIDVAEFDEGRGAFFVAYVDGPDGLPDVPVATGAWRWIDTPSAVASTTAVAELKRMYVRREHRRQGWARMLLVAVEADAVAAGVEHMVLETGLAQGPAIAMYRSAGYVDLSDFGHYAPTGVAVALQRPL